MKKLRVPTPSASLMNKMVPKKIPKKTKMDPMWNTSFTFLLHISYKSVTWNKVDKCGHNADTMWTQCGHRRVATGFGFIWGARGVATRMPMETSLEHFGAIIGKVKTVLPSRREHHLCGQRVS